MKRFIAPMTHFSCMERCILHLIMKRFMTTSEEHLEGDGCDYSNQIIRISPFSHGPLTHPFPLFHFKTCLPWYVYLEHKIVYVYNKCIRWPVRQGFFFSNQIIGILPFTQGSFTHPFPLFHFITYLPCHVYLEHKICVQYRAWTGQDSRWRTLAPAGTGSSSGRNRILIRFSKI